MELSQLIEALADPTSYPHPVEDVVVHQTHISAVFLAGPFAYKIKKPVSFGFVDFSSLEKRRHFCEEEVRLNRRLAQGVYLGVIPLTIDHGRVAVEGTGEVFEWAVKMVRLPDEARLADQLSSGDVSEENVRGLGRRIAEFHEQAESSPQIAESARFEAVARLVLENFEQAEQLVNVTISQGVLDRLRERAGETLETLRPLIESRADQGLPRDTHGDLRCEHVYLFPDQDPPDDLIIVDAIEFQEKFRHADPVADLAFLVMDLKAAGRRDLAQVLADSYFEASQDESGRALLSFYMAYRAAVRGKVEGLALQDREIPKAERSMALAEARGHWLLALGELERPEHRPGLVLVAGLPGAGKSTLAKGLADHLGFEVIRSDVVRKELAGLAPDQSANADWGHGIYSEPWSDRTYAECQRRADALLFEGRRVVVDATFGIKARRDAFLELASRRCVPGLLLVCQAAPETIQARLQERQGQLDASDADLKIYQKAVDHWEAIDQESRHFWRAISTDNGLENALEQVIEAFSSVGL